MRDIDFDVIIPRDHFYEIMESLDALKVLVEEVREKGGLWDQAKRVNMTYHLSNAYATLIVDSIDCDPDRARAARAEGDEFAGVRQSRKARA